MKGLYVIENYTYPDFEELEAKGCTDIFFADSALLRNYTTCKNNVNNILTAMQGTNLNLWLDEDSFGDGAGNSLVDPKDMTHRNRFCIALSQILTDIPELKGVALEDYFWHSGWEGTSASYDTILTDFALQIKTTLRDVDSKKIFAPTVGWQASCLPSVAAVSDILIAQCYYDKHHYKTPPYTSLKWVLDHVKDTPIIPILGTFRQATGLPLRPLSDIFEDIANVTRLQSSDYILYAWPWVQEGFVFTPHRSYADREHLTKKYSTRYYASRNY